MRFNGVENISQSLYDNALCLDRVLTMRGYSIEQPWATGMGNLLSTLPNALHSWYSTCRPRSSTLKPY